MYHEVYMWHRPNSLAQFTEKPKVLRVLRRQNGFQDEIGNEFA